MNSANVLPILRNSIQLYDEKYIKGNYLRHVVTETNTIFTVEIADIAS